MVMIDGVDNISEEIKVTISIMCIINMTKLVLSQDIQI